jgi:hypothetical protein
MVDARDQFLHFEKVKREGKGAIPLGLFWGILILVDD